MKPSAPDWILLGIVRRAHGIKGALAIKLFNPSSNTLHSGSEVILGTKSFEVMTVHTQGLISLKGISDRNAAEKLSGLEIWIRRNDLPTPDPGELYLADLIGFKAEDIHGNFLGEVTGFSDNGPQILVEVAGKMLIPMVKPLWASVDETAGKLIFDLPEGYE